jgi:hypothetical protein
MKKIRNIALLAAMITALTSCQMPWQDKLPDELGVKPDAPFVLKGVSNLTQVAQITGYESINKTHEYEIYGTDLGSMFNYGDKTYLVFGDTFGYRPPDKTGAGGADWRSNTIAISSDQDPSDGISIEGVIADYGNHAKEVLPSAKVDYDEMTKIPTHGIAVGALDYHLSERRNRDSH